MKLFRLNVILAFLFIGLSTALPVLESILNNKAISSGSSKSNYVLVFENGNTTPIDRVTQIKSKIIEIGGSITYEYSLTITGFSFKLDEKIPIAKLNGLNNSKWPFFIEKDTPVKVK